MDKAERLTELLKKAPDRYPGFERMILFSCGRFPEGYDKLTAFIEKNPNATTVEISAFFNELKRDL